MKESSTSGTLGNNCTPLTTDRNHSSKTNHGRQASDNVLTYISKELCLVTSEWRMCLNKSIKRL